MGTEQQKGSLEDCMSEATMEKYMNDNGLRFKMNKTAKEREGRKYGYSKYYPGSWFYYDQLSTDPDENGRGQINTPANRQMSGFRMRKGGFYLDGTKDTRT